MRNQIQPTDTSYQVNLSELTARTPQDTDLMLVQQAGDNPIAVATVADVLNLLASTLAAVATSGDYADLIGKPDILPVNGKINDYSNTTGTVQWATAVPDTSSISILRVSTLNNAGNWSAFICDANGTTNHTSHSLLIVNDTASDKTVTVVLSGAADYVITGDTNATFTVKASGYTELNLLEYDSYPALIIKEY